LALFSEEKEIVMKKGVPDETGEYTWEKPPQYYRNGSVYIKPEELVDSQVFHRQQELMERYVEKHMK